MAKNPQKKKSRNNLVAGFFSLLLVFTAFTLSGCQTTPVRYDQEKLGTWEAKALIRDKKTKNSYVVNMDIMARLNDKLRMDVTTPIGIHVASLVMRADQVEYMLVRKKQYFTGQSQPKVLSPILSVPLDPQILHNVLFDLPINNKNWTCTRDEKGLLSECRNLYSGLVMAFSDRSGQRKTVKIEHPDASVQINFNSFEPSIRNEETVFNLKVPSSFKKYRVK